MANSGDIEHVATKVVPYYVVGVVGDETETTAPSPGVESEQSDPGARHGERDRKDTGVRRHRPMWLGYVVAGLGVATLVLLMVAMVVSLDGDFSGGTTLSYVTIGVSAFAAILAITCLVLGYKRRWAAFGLALAILANPVALVTVLGFFEG